MDVDYMILADAAIEAQGKHYIHGAGWDTINAVQFPALHPTLTIVVLLRVPWNEANVRQRLEVDIRDADGVSILPNPPGPAGGGITVGRPPTVAPGNDILVPLVFQMAGIVFQRAGDYVVELRLEGEVIKRFPLHLVASATQDAGRGAPQQ